MANVVFTSYAFPATGGTTSRTMPARLTDVVNVLEFTGVDPTGATDSLAGINAAIAAAITQGSSLGTKGATIFFPPGAYKVSGPITNSTTSTSVRLLGSGRTTTTIFGGFAGFIINQNTNPSGIVAIEHMSVINSHLSSGIDLTNGAIQFNNVQNGLLNSLYFQGWTGICMTANALATGWETTILDCASTGGYRDQSGTNNGLAGCIGIYSAQGGIGIYNTECLGYNIGMNICGSTNVLSRCRTEVCCTGLLLGYDLAGTPPGPQSFLSGSTINGFSTERCDISVLMWDVNSVVMEGSLLTGTIGTWNDVVSIVGNGTTATVTTAFPLANYGWSSGTKPIYIDSSNVGFNTGASPVTGTRTGASTFTYASSHVGTENHYSPAGPSWSLQQQYGLRARSWQSTIISVDANIGNVANAGIDLSYGGTSTMAAAAGNSGLTMIGCLAGTAGWLVPGDFTVKAGVQYISCDQPRGSTTDAGGNVSGMKYHDLPGQGGIPITTAKEGMEYDIIDCNASSFGATAAGGGSTHARVRYNGTNWTVMGV